MDKMLARVKAKWYGNVLCGSFQQRIGSQGWRIVSTTLYSGGIVATRWIDAIAGEISGVAAMELNKYNNTLQVRWGRAEEVVVQASHLVIEQALNHPLTVSQKNIPKIS